MMIECPGCLTKLVVDEEGFQDKVLLKCPQCLYIFLLDEKSHSKEIPQPKEDKEGLGEATLLVSDSQHKGEKSGVQWNVPCPSLTVIQGNN